MFDKTHSVYSDMSLMTAWRSQTRGHTHLPPRSPDRFVLSPHLASQPRSLRKILCSRAGGVTLVVMVRVDGAGGRRGRGQLCGTAGTLTGPVARRQPPNGVAPHQICMATLRELQEEPKRERIF